MSVFSPGVVGNGDLATGEEPDIIIESNYGVGKEDYDRVVANQGNSTNNF